MANRKVISKTGTKVKKIDTSDLQYRYAVKIKAPFNGAIEDEDGPTGELIPTFIYVADKGAHQVVICESVALYQLIAGKRLAKKKNPALFKKKNTHFLIGFRKSDNAHAVVIDDYPAQLFGSNSTNAPEFRREQEQIVVTVHQPTGSLSMEELPVGLISNRTQVRALFKAIHEEDTIQPGDTLADRFYVEGIAGNKLYIDVIGAE